ncbi:MAG: metallophosphoesterase [Pseudohongiellaceae bacterium]|jgi:predicted MPP superfamily phosphohydrolase
MKGWLKNALASAGLLLVGAGLYREATQLDVTHHDLRTETAYARAVIVVQISDLHLHSIGRREQAVIEQVTLLQPDLLVLSGDVIDDAASLPTLEHFLSRLAATNKVAVPGNWEHWAGVELAELRALYARQATALLVNEQIRYPVGDRTLVITGLDDYTGGYPDAAILNTPQRAGETHLLVQHSPGWFETAAAQAHGARFTLCLAGHTHGGQVAPFGIALWKPPGSGGFLAGRYEVSLCPLYVSRGVGTSIAPLRLGAQPELAVFML